MSDASRLWQLQEIDLEIMRCEAALNAMPQVEKLKALIAGKKKISSELNRLKGLRKDLEMEIEETTSNRDAYEVQIADVKESAAERAQSFRAVNDLEAQLTSLSKRVEKANFTLEEKNAALDKIKANEEKGFELAKKLEVEARATKQSFDEQSEQIRSTMEELMQKRESVAEDIDAETIERYEAARERFKGFGVEKLESNVPSTCRVQLQAGAYQELMRGPSISECPYCHRMLVIERGSDD